MINNLRSYHLPNEENIYSHYLTKKKMDKDQLDNIVKNIERNEDYLANKKLIKDFDVSFVDNPNSKKIAYSLSKYVENQKYHSSRLESKGILSSISKIETAEDLGNNDKDKFIDSLSDLFDDIKSTINTGKADYLDVLKDLFSNYMDFVSAIRTLLSKLSEATKAAKKEGRINIHLDDFYNELQDLKNKYSGKPLLSLDLFFKKDKEGRYYREIKGEKIFYNNKDDINRAMKALGNLLDGIKGVNVIKGDGEGSDHYFDPYLEFWFNVQIDFTDLESLLKSLKDKGLGSQDILQSEFDLLKKMLDSFEKKLNNNLDEFSKKYSTANSNYDNFVKIVSSTMNTLLEMAKGFLRF